MVPRRTRVYYVYITASISDVLYIGYTDSLYKRIAEHKGGFYENAFSKKYNVNRLVYWEHYFSKADALKRERQIKRYRREKKIKLIEEHNPDWEDLYSSIIELSKLA